MFFFSFVRAYDIERTANESSSWWNSLTTFVRFVFFEKNLKKNTLIFLRSVQRFNRVAGHVDWKSKTNRPSRNESFPLFSLELTIVYYWRFTKRFISIEISFLRWHTFVVEHIFVFIEENLRFVLDDRKFLDDKKFVDVNKRKFIIELGTSNYSEYARECVETIRFENVRFSCSFSDRSKWFFWFGRVFSIEQSSFGLFGILFDYSTISKK